MTNKEKEKLYEYFYVAEIRLEENVDIWDMRATRSRLDSVDHLEEILAKEQLKTFRAVRDDILNLLKFHIEKEDWTFYNGFEKIINYTK